MSWADSTRIILPKKNSPATSEVTVEFNILDPDAKTDTKIDTESDWVKYDNTASEKVIKSIHLFAVGYDTETGIETVEEVVKADLVPGDFTSDGVRTGHTFTLRSGIKRFYVGANMREDHIEAFCSKNALRADSYESSLSMVMNGYDSKTDEGYFFDFQFILYNANMTFNIQETKDPEQSSLFNSNPNWNIADWVTLDPANDKIRMNTMADCEGNFSFWGTEDIADRLDSPSEWWCSSVPSSSSDYLGQGLYCLEKTVFDDPGDALVLDGENKVNAAFLTTTHVFLKMRIAPSTVYGSDMTSANTNSEVSKIGQMSWNYDRNGNNPYTIYVSDESGARKYYTANGVQGWITGNYDDEKFYKVTEYTGGWVYYRTFIEEGGQDSQDNKISFDGMLVLLQRGHGQ